MAAAPAIAAPPIALTQDAQLTPAMDADEEVQQLKGVVMQTLETKGVLQQIRAQLRASVFDVVQGQAVGATNSSKPVPQLDSTIHGALLRDLVLEYLSFHGMKYTRDLFCCEASLSSANTPGREHLQRQLEFAPEQTSDMPVLEGLLGAHMSRAQGDAAGVTERGAHTNSDTRKVQAARAAIAPDEATELSSLDSMGESSADEAPKAASLTSAPHGGDRSGATHTKHLSDLPDIPGRSPPSKSLRSAMASDTIPVRSSGDLIWARVY